MKTQALFYSLEPHFTIYQMEAIEELTWNQTNGWSFTEHPSAKLDGFIVDK